MIPSWSRPSRIDAAVIGTSAGGVEALGQILPFLPADLRIPVLVVLHLPRQPSLLVELFQPKCALRVKEADHEEPVTAGTIYFAPPDYHLMVDSGPRIALSVDPPVHFSRPSIDVLFESAADVYGARLVGIILTGASADGSRGLEAVRDAGGITIAQQPGEARESFMIASALRRSPPDLVLPLTEIADAVGSL